MKESSGSIDVPIAKTERSVPRKQRWSKRQNLITAQN